MVKATSIKLQFGIIFAIVGGSTSQAGMDHILMYLGQMNYTNPVL